MITRAITSARNHGMTLKPGSSNPGNGDCAFEAVIQNNNDRGCFLERKNNVDKLLQKNVGHRYGKQNR